MIEVSHEPKDIYFLTPETCCFCRKQTRYWFVPKDVACCQECAKTATADQVPDKKTWIAQARSERLASEL